MIDKNNITIQWHDIGPICTLMGIAPEDEKVLFSTLLNLTHSELKSELKKIETLTKSERLKKAIYLHRKSEFFINCLPDSFEEKK